MKSIKNNVFEFYANNFNKCNEEYDVAMDPKIDGIYEQIKSLKDINVIFSKTSVVLLTANKYERNILHQKIFKIKNKKIKQFEIELLTNISRYNRVNAYYFEYENYSILHIHANVTGSYTIGGSADIVRWILSNEYLYPTQIISFGICFGTNEKETQIGDVIISRKIYPYFIGSKMNKDKLYVVNDNFFEVDSYLSNKICNLENNNAFSLFKVHFEDYTTGEAVISSKKFRNQIITAIGQPIFAGDMESYGLFKECKSNSLNVSCFVLKSICDWGINKNFNQKDCKLLNEILNKYNCVLSGYKLENLLKTLKDRIQAFSVSRAFEILQILFERRIFKESLYRKIEYYIGKCTGAEITCQYIFDEINKIEKCEKPLTMKFLYECLNGLSEDGKIQIKKRELSPEKNNCTEEKFEYFIILSKKKKGVPTI